MNRKRLDALKIFNQEIKIDGELNESAWTKAIHSGDFIQNFPNPGTKSRFKTEVALMYDDNAVYIAAWMYDPQPDSILVTLSERDQNDNADLFRLGFDTYNDDQNAFIFGVTAAGVQMDSRASSNDNDDSWNAVWQSSAKINEIGWVVEIKIPLSAIRFPEKKIQEWGINFERTIRRFRETSNWNYVDPRIDGDINQFGSLDGMHDIKSPLRLSLTPYVSAYYDQYTDKKNDINEVSTNFNGGMDLKYGINDAFTLDMTLVPDFGQVQYDNRILNTTPFEVRYNEFRQFFTEGTEIYNKSDLFYSRRIGGVPINYYDVSDRLDGGEILKENPSASKLLNASKITGRTKSGTGIGFFNAVTKPTYAIAEDSAGTERKILTDPLTNYNVFVIDQNLKNNSFINLTNTNVMRDGHTYDANVTGINSQLNTKGNRFGFDVMGKLSQQYGLPENDSITLGYTAGFGAYKKYGNFTFGAYYGEESDTYDPNDLGFLYNNNSRVMGAELNYRAYEPKGRFLNKWLGAEFNYERLYKPDAFMIFNTTISTGAVFKNWMAAGAYVFLQPLHTYDYFEPRVWGRYYEFPNAYSTGFWISSDYRKKFAVDLRPSINKYNYKDWIEYTINFSPRYRFSDKLSTILGMFYEYNNGEQGSALDFGGSPVFIGDTIVFASRNRTTYENSILVKYIFTNRMALSFRARHYWSKIEYTKFHELTEDGKLAAIDYTGNDLTGNSLHNTSFNAFNIDLIFTWVFAPGSELRVVWKNSIYSYNQQTALNYFEDFEETIGSPQTNSLSIKFIYFIDALQFKRKK